MQVQSLIYLGSSFHNFGTAALKGLSPNVDQEIYLWKPKIKRRLNANYILCLFNRDQITDVLRGKAMNSFKSN